jgi:hypothetical protein
VFNAPQWEHLKAGTFRSKFFSGSSSSGTILCYVGLNNGWMTVGPSSLLKKWAVIQPHRADWPHSSQDVDLRKNLNG